MNTPKISILMPCYNVEKYVAEAVESILNQTFTDFELLAIDDCSTDGTATEIQRFSDKRITYYKNEKNLGLVETLNFGLSVACGKFVARMDGDDISLPERLEKQVDFLEQNADIALCSTGMRLFGTENAVWLREPKPEDVKITMMFFSPVLHASSMWRRNFFADNNLIYRHEAFPAEDYDLWQRAVFYGKLTNLPEILYLYRIHGVQVTKTNSQKERVTKQVQKNFIERALLSVNEQDIDFFVNFTNKKITKKEEIIAAKKVIFRFISANKTDNFFEQNRFTFRLKRYFQNRVFEFIKENKKYNLLLIKELRLRQILKLILE